MSARPLSSTAVRVGIAVAGVAGAVAVEVGLVGVAEERAVVAGVADAVAVGVAGLGCEARARGSRSRIGVARTRRELPARSVPTTPIRTVARRPRRSARSTRRRSRAAEPHPQHDAPAADRHRPPVALDRQRQAADVEEAGGAEHAALARGGEDPHPAQRLRRRGAGAHPRRALVGAGGAGLGRRRDRRALDALAVGRDGVERVRLDAIGARAAAQVVGLAVAAAQQVVAGAAVEEVAAEPAVERVGAVLARQRVVARAAVEAVVAARAREAVAPVAPEQRVRAGAGGERVGARPAAQDDRDGQPHDRAVLALAEVDADGRGAARRAGHLDDPARPRRDVERAGTGRGRCRRRPSCRAAAAARAPPARSRC